MALRASEQSGGPRAIAGLPSYWTEASKAPTVGEMDRPLRGSIDGEKQYINNRADKDNGGKTEEFNGRFRRDTSNEKGHQRPMLSTGICRKTINSRDNPINKLRNSDTSRPTEPIARSGFEKPKKRNVKKV